MTMNELRIGNYFHPCFWSNGGNGKQRILLPDESKIYRVGELLFSGVRVIDPHRPDSPTFQYVETVPVKLTPELLEKCGFINLNGEQFDIKIGRGQICIFPSNGHFKWYPTGINDDGYWMPCELKNIHQLQNIIYALTGQELEVKL